MFNSAALAVRRTAVGFLPLFAPLALDAQAASDSTTKDSTGQRLSTVSVSATRAAAIVGGTAAVVIRPEELRSSPAPLLDEALRESPFVLVRQNSRGEMEISVRGSDSRQAAVLVDGVPITLGWDHRTDPSLVPITGTERLVIIRGLASLLNGPNSLGGSIEISHDATGQPTTGRLWAGAELDQFGASVGTLGYGRRWDVVRGGSLSLRTGVASRQRDGVALAGGVTDTTAADGLRTGTDLSQVDGFVSLRWSSPGGRSLGAMISAFDASRGVPPEEHIAAPRLWRFPYHRRAIAMVSATTGIFSTPFGSGSLEAGVGVNSGALKIESFSSRTYRTVSATELGDERTVTTRLLLTHTLRHAMLRASYIGADVSYVETLPPAAAADYRQTLHSSGVEIETPVGLHGKLAGGVVFDRTRTPETGGRTPSQPPMNSAGWRLGATRDVGARLKLHAGASARSRFPSLRELYSGALNRFRPNPDLKPERLLGVEGGLTMRGPDASRTPWSLQAIGFRHRLDDAVVRITLSNPTRFMRVNRDRIESDGIELLGGVAFGADAARAVTLNGDATLQHIRIADRTANNLPRHAENNPETRARLELGVPLPRAARAFATARVTGRQYCLNADTKSEDALRGRTVADLALQRDFAVASGGLFTRLRAVLAMDNVGDVAVYDQCGLPQPGRTLRLTMSLR